MHPPQRADQHTGFRMETPKVLMPEQETDLSSEQTAEDYQFVNRYYVTERIAQGGLSTVYKGQDRVLNRPVAIKVMDRTVSSVYQSALRVGASLTHPAIVAVYDAFEDADGDRFVLVQEFITARPVSYFIRSGVPAERAVDLVGQVARALAYAHSHGIVHGDLSTAAVLIDRRAQVRVNNFGLPQDDAYFQLFDQPEGITGDNSLQLSTTHVARASERSLLVSPSHHNSDGWLQSEDVRAAGLILWQLLSRPVTLRDEEQSVREFRTDVPSQVRDLVIRCVQREDPARISSAADLAEQLEAAQEFLAGQRSQVSESTPPALAIARAAAAPRSAAPVRPAAVGQMQGWPYQKQFQPASSSFERAPTDPQWQMSGRSASPYTLEPPRWDRQGSFDPNERSPWLQANRPVARVQSSQVQPGMTVRVLVIIGVILFLACFVVGFFGPPLLTQH